MSSNLKFRFDVNGLRAWAVLSVVLYHFEIAGFASGFVGVDIFFVISGYLMTRIILEGHEKNNSGSRDFSIYRFYIARAKRIIPALSFFSCIMLVFGWFFLELSEYRLMGAEALFALTFTSNYKYWLNPESGGGYFADDELFRWFLHSWSLSVEWQFYLLLPIIIAGIWKLRPSRAFVQLVLCLIFLLSLIASVLEVHRNAELAFYSIHTRAWEMLAGGIVYFLSVTASLKKHQAIWLERIGFLCIFFAVFLDQPEHLWPGYHALLPVAGTALVLLSNRQDSILTNTIPAQIVGKISYSMYLWHWPIVMTLRYVGLLDSLPWIILGLLATTALSIASYYLIEQQVATWMARRTIWITSACAAAMVLLPTAAGALVRVSPATYVKSYEDLQKFSVSAQNDYHPRRNECLIYGAREGSDCTFGGERLGAVTLGDSHAFTIITALKDALPSNDLHVLDISSSGCAPLLEANRIEANLSCKEFIDWGMNRLSNVEPDIPVIIGSRSSAWLYGRVEDPKSEQRPLITYGNRAEQFASHDFLNRYRSDQIQTLCKIAAERPTYYVLPIPEMGRHIPKVMLRRAKLGLSTDIGIPSSRYYERNRFVLETIEIAAQRCGIRILDPTDYLCTKEICWGSKDGEALYFDEDHLSETGNKLLVPMFEQIWKD